MSAGIRRRQLPRRLSGTCCAAPATRHSLPSRPTQSSGNLRVDPPYHVQSPQRIFHYVLLSLRCAGEELVCLDSTGRPFKVVDGPVQNGCLGEAYPGGTAVPFPEESGDTRINVSGNQASLYFECHDIGDYELPTRFIAPDTFLAGTGISSPS